MKSLFIAFALIALSACGRGERKEEVTQDNYVEANTAAPVDNIAIAAPPADVAAPTNRAAPPPAFSDAEQIRDDADATGLTARINQGGETAQSSPTANETRPAE